MLFLKNLKNNLLFNELVYCAYLGNLSGGLQNLFLLNMLQLKNFEIFRTKGTMLNSKAGVCLFKI